MNNTIKKGFKSLKFVLSAQIIVLILGVFKALVVPSFLSIEDFGYWQIYLFYSSYVGIFALGFNDGIYLKYGNYKYADLPYQILRGSIRIHIILLSVFAVITFFVAKFLQDNDKEFAFWFIAINIIIMGINGVFIYILQITNQMKLYSFFIVLSKIILLFGIIFLSLFETVSFKYLVILDVFANLITVIGMVFVSKQLLFGKTFYSKEVIKEYKENVNIGIKLMIAQLMGMLLLGLGRFLIEWFGSIEEYAFYSFGITVTNLVLSLITAISLVLYPTLKRLKEKKFPLYYEKISNLIGLVNYLVPILFLLCTVLVPILLPKYSPVLEYINMLFAIIMIQSRMQMLINTFYKALRKEKEMMKLNVYSVIVFIVITPVTYSFLNNVWSVVMCTFVVMFFHSIISENYLHKTMKIISNSSLYVDGIFIVSFVVLSSSLSLKYFILIYLVFLIYIAMKKIKKIIFFIDKNLGEKWRETDGT